MCDKKGTGMNNFYLEEVFFLWFLNTDKQAAENTRRSQAFLTNSWQLSVFRNQRMDTFECLNLLLKFIDILGENRD